MLRCKDPGFSFKNIDAQKHQKITLYPQTLFRIFGNTLQIKIKRSFSDQNLQFVAF